MPTAASPRAQPVPRDRLLAVPDSPAPDRGLCNELFLEMHRDAESHYNGDGSWGKGCAQEGVFDNVNSPCSKPLIRHTTERVSAYLSARDSFPDSRGLLTDRARAGCERLLREQRPDGYFPYYLDDSGWPRLDSHGIMYVSGIGIDALLDGYEAFGDIRYLQGAYRGCEWARRFPCVANTNYNAFLAWPLARFSEVVANAPGIDRPVLGYTPVSISKEGAPVEPDPVEDGLEQSLSIVEQGIFPNQQPNGGWPGHNSWIWYHGIILLGLSHLLRVLPEAHEAYGPVRECATAATNYAITNISAEGDFLSNYESDTPGNPRYCFWAFRIMKPADPAEADAIARLKRIAAHATIRFAAANRQTFVNPERNLNTYICSELIHGLGKVAGYLDSES